MRWGCLWRKLCFKLTNSTAIVQACMKVHNLCISLGEGEVPLMRTEGSPGNDVASLHFTNDCFTEDAGDPRRRGSAGVGTHVHRNQLIRSMENRRRPPRSNYSTKAARA